MRMTGLAAFAAALLLTACATTPPPPPPVGESGTAEVDPARFAEQIAAFAEEDRLALRPPCQIVFTGSSSIRRWTTLGEDLAPLPVLNRGFGGAHISDVNHYFEQVAGRYRPAAVVFYAGENDLSAGKDPRRVVADFERFMQLKTQALGGTPVYFIPLKPSKSRWGQFAAQNWINARIRAMADRRADLDYIDVVPAMLEDGRPREIFVEDDLHMTPAGYEIWTAIVKPVLQRDAVRLSATCARR